jgi:3-dehydroquinate dehydratase-1
VDTDRFTLAATTDDLGREPGAREWADVVEFRMDRAEAPVEQLADYDGDLSVLATNRARWAGGDAPDAGRLDRLLEAAAFDAVQAVDVELESARDGSETVDALQSRDVHLVVSYHEFDGTPDLSTLDETFRECARYGDVAKVATHATDSADTLRMLRATHGATADGLRVAGISMGEVGRHTRVVAPLYGSRLGYAPLGSDERDYAPGQIPLDELAGLIDALGTGESRVTRD